MLKDEAADAMKTAVGVVSWIALDAVLPEFKNRGANAATDALAVFIAVAVVHLAVMFVRWRPAIRIEAESLHDASSPVGRKVDRSPFTPALVGSSVWLLVRVSFRRSGPLARWIAGGFRSSGHVLEITVEPANGVSANVEKANGATVKSLRDGRRGARIDLPSPLPIGEFVVFQVELIPVLDPAPLPLTTTVTFVRSKGKGRRGLRFTKVACDLRELHILR